MSNYQITAETKVAKLVVTAKGVKKLTYGRLGYPFKFNGEEAIIKEGKDAGIESNVFNDIVNGGIYTVVRRTPADGSTPFLMVVSTGEIKPV